jgi:GH25 family lysozyme M1 (1,4-beta-N-acetylmuramidase)
MGCLLLVVGISVARAANECPSTVIEGVDVSSVNNSVSWSSVQGSGKGFAFAFATQGDYHTDASFATNWPGIKAAGMSRSAIHFFDPTIDGITQANYFLAAINGAGGSDKADLPVALDLECPTSSVQPSADPNCESTGNSGWVATSVLVQRVFDWLNTVQTATGKRPVIYTYPAWFSDVSFTDLRLARYPVYIASIASCANVPSPWATATFWQYSLSGTVTGITGNSTDLDRFVGSPAELSLLVDRIFADSLEGLPQVITFTSLQPTTAEIGGPTYLVSATASSGLSPVLTIDASATSVCSIAGSTVSFSAVGTCVIDANQAGDANFSAAPQAQQSFTVSACNPPNLTVVDIQQQLTNAQYNSGAGATFGNLCIHWSPEGTPSQPSIDANNPGDCAVSIVNIPNWVPTPFYLTPAGQTSLTLPIKVIAQVNDPTSGTCPAGYGYVGATLSTEPSGSAAPFTQDPNTGPVAAGSLLSFTFTPDVGDVGSTPGDYQISVTMSFGTSQVAVPLNTIDVVGTCGANTPMSSFNSPDLPPYAMGVSIALDASNSYDADNVVLDLTGSSGTGCGLNQVLSYVWSFSPPVFDGTTFTYANPASNPTQSFTPQSANTTYIVLLQVSDGTLTSSPVGHDFTTGP